MGYPARSISVGPFIILIIENDTMLRNLMMAVLVREHYSVFEAAGTGEAVRLSDGIKNIIDLIITGPSLNAGTFRRAAEDIRQSRPAIKILQISGYPLDALKRHGGSIPGSEFLTKSFLVADFQQTVKWIFAGMRNAPRPGAIREMRHWDLS